MKLVLVSLIKHSHVYPKNIFKFTDKENTDYLYVEFTVNKHITCLIYSHLTLSYYLRWLW